MMTVCEFGKVCVCVGGGVSSAAQVCIAAYRHGPRRGRLLCRSLSLGDDNVAYVTQTLDSWSTAQGNLLPCSTLLIHIRVSDSCTLTFWFTLPACDLTCVTHSTGSACPPLCFSILCIIALLSAKSFLGT